jgi:hypothetical protein
VDHGVDRLRLTTPPRALSEEPEERPVDLDALTGRPEGKVRACVFSTYLDHPPAAYLNLRYPRWRAQIDSLTRVRESAQIGAYRARQRLGRGAQIDLI